MRRQRRQNELYLGMRFITEGEMRLVRQRQLIARLKKQGRPTSQAESVLVTFELMVFKLRNHLEVMKTLMRAD
jgi:hypothetical protein